MGRIPDLTLPWNSFESERAQRDLAPPMHASDPHFLGMTVSFDGRLVAMTVPQTPSNEVAVIDIVSMRGWRIRHPHRRVMLAYPGFLPDGKLSVVVTPPPRYFGVSEIWINTLFGDERRVRMFGRTRTLRARAALARLRRRAPLRGLVPAGADRFRGWRQHTFAFPINAARERRA